MKKFNVQVFTDEHTVNVLIGKKKEVIVEIYKYRPKDTTLKEIEEVVKDSDGSFWEFDSCPSLVVVNTDDSDYNSQIHTLAHEAVHAAKYIADHLGIKDKSGEFMAYSVETIVKAGLSYIKKK